MPSFPPTPVRRTPIIALALWLMACSPQEDEGSPRIEPTRGHAPVPESVGIPTEASTPFPSGIEYSTDRSTYQIGDTVVSRLVNASDQQVGYNLCISSLEQRSGTEWTRTSIEPSTCPAILLALQPGDTAEHRQALQQLPSGVYRLRTDVEAPVGKVRTDLVTEPFILRE